MLPSTILKLSLWMTGQELVSIYERAFEVAGLKVVAKFGNGKEVLEYFGSTKNGSPEGIVLLDHKMPEMTGVEIAKRIKERYPDQRIILALAETPVKFTIDERLFDGTIFKPFTISELLDEIERVISPIRIKGSKIISEPEEIENLLRDILSDSKEEVCSIRNPEFIRKRAEAQDRGSTYTSAKSKGLNVYLITQITHKNLGYCKLLLLDQGVECHDMWKEFCRILLFGIRNIPLKVLKRLQALFPMDTSSTAT